VRPRNSTTILWNSIIFPGISHNEAHLQKKKCSPPPKDRNLLRSNTL
jgi:hypothetical protein